ncbi:proteasome assembly chaperone family protein, partial [Candidatus Bathyarchaeota archaeon]
PDSGGRDLILLTGDAQVQDVEGQYLVSSEILKYAKNLGVDMVITTGGYQSHPGKTPLVVAASTNVGFLDRLKEAGAKVGGWGNPIVGLAGVLMGLTTFYGMDGVCLLGETLGYIVDTKAAREVLKVLGRLIGLDIPLDGLERDILKDVGEAISEVEAEMRSLERILERTREEKITYIS